MKASVLLLTVFFGISMSGTLKQLTHNYVASLVATNSALTVDACFTQCDAVFVEVNPHDEKNTDHTCKHECHCPTFQAWATAYCVAWYSQIDKNCTSHGHQHNKVTAVPTAVPAFPGK